MVQDCCWQHKRKRSSGRQEAHYIDTFSNKLDGSNDSGHLHHALWEATRISCIARSALPWLNEKALCDVKHRNRIATKIQMLRSKGQKDEATYPFDAGRDCLNPFDSILPSLGAQLIQGKTKFVRPSVKEP